MKKLIPLVLLASFAHGQEFALKAPSVNKVLESREYLMQSLPPAYQLFSIVGGVPTAVTSTLSTGQLNYIPPAILAKCLNSGVIVDCSFSGGGGGTGTVTTFSCVTANGVSCTVANPTTTPAATFTLGAITPTSITGSSMTPQSIDCHTACSPTAAQLSNSMVSNFGQGAANITITGPTAAAGMNFIMIVGTAQASNFWQYTSTTANIYLDAATSAKTTITFAAPAVGNSFSCFSFQTGASTYSLKCTTLAGTSTSS